MSPVSDSDGELRKLLDEVVDPIDELDYEIERLIDSLNEKLRYRVMESRRRAKRILDEANEEAARIISDAHISNNDGGMPLIRRFPTIRRLRN